MMIEHILRMISMGIGSATGAWLVSKFYIEPKLDEVIKRAERLSRRH